MILFHAHAFPAKSLEKGAKTEFTPVFRRRWHQTLHPPSSTGKLPPHCDLKGRCTFRHVTVFCWYLSPAARQGNIQKNPGISNLWLQSSKRRPIILDSNPAKTRAINILSMAIWFAVRGEQNLRCALRFDWGAWFRAFRNLPAKKKKTKPFFLRELLLNSGTISRTLSRTVQNLAPARNSPKSCRLLAGWDPMGIRKLGETKRGAHFGSFLRLLLFLNFSGKLFRNGCIYYIDMFF